MNPKVHIFAHNRTHQPLSSRSVIRRKKQRLVFHRKYKQNYSIKSIMKKAYVRPQFTCLSIEVEKILSGSDQSLEIINEGGTGPDMTSGFVASDWDED